jgi:succinate dehydrogenase/fumarate reductase flavoprotein subunit
LIKAIKSKLEIMPNVKFEYSAEMTDLIWQDENEERSIKGLVYRNSAGDVIQHHCDAVILASGGMAHSIDSDGIFAEFAPHLRGLATSSGPQADGSGMVIARKVCPPISL